MKLIEKDLVVNGAGTATMVAQEPDDIWFLFGLVSVGDMVAAESARKIHYATRDGNKGSAARVKVKLEIKLTATDYDKDGCCLRVRGKNISSDAYVATGAFHTIEIKLELPFELKKKVWEKSQLDMLLTRCESETSPELAVVLIQQEGIASLSLVGKGGSINQCAKIEETSAASRKNGASKKTSNATSNKFFNSLVQSFKEHVDFTFTKHVVIASPGTLKDKFLSYLLAEAQRLQLKSILDNKSRFVLVVTSSQNLKEILDTPAVKKFVQNSDESEGSDIYEEFTDMLAIDANRVCYGSKCVEMANEFEAIKTLLITDDLFRSSNIVTREKYESLVVSVKKSGGICQVFSSGHVCGKELGKMTGIAAILRFPILNLDDLVL
ncbi:hypothetical protein AQUCO_05800086v1 [Aquilegia coerulea]|uniref:Protein pelota homolog n=1 Tax=Aquilegia coerulea TaxID=218851 RepID=A0A2G5CET1_AQUCA|nr:hypothetical protein AQUCO_05800086v1 [Aquilegia coerulea]